MSREQRRLDRKKAGGAPPNRRTPVKAPGGGGIPWTPIAIVGGLLLIGLLIVYLILQQGGDNETLSASDKAEQDSSPELAGTFVPSQGRGHFNFTFSLERTPTPFCAGVRWSGAPEGEPGGGTPVPGSTGTPPAATAVSTPTAVGTTAAGSPTREPSPTEPPSRTECRASNPPTSGEHLGVQRNVDVTGNGDLINIPPDPDVYPEDIVIPRDAVPHLQEHAGVYIGWNCPEGDQACRDIVEDLEGLANDRIDNFDDRVIMSRDPDLVVGEIAIASWTRFMVLPYAEYERDEFEKFISDHACRFDPEGFCG